jgi:hypothetical protein
MQIDNVVQYAKHRSYFSFLLALPRHLGMFFLKHTKSILIKKILFILACCMSVRWLQLLDGFEIDIQSQTYFVSFFNIYVTVDDATVASRNSAGIVNGAITFSRGCTLV